MWSSERDRKRAAFLETRLTAAQQKVKERLERSWNAGFDTAIKSTTPAEVLRMIRFDHPKYVSDRKELFDAWHREERCREAGL